MPDPTPQPTPTVSPPPRPKGEALRWTPDEIAALAQIDAGDVAAARAFYRRVAPGPFKDLLGAKIAEQSPGRAD